MQLHLHDDSGHEGIKPRYKDKGRPDIVQRTATSQGIFDKKRRFGGQCKGDK